MILEWLNENALRSFPFILNCPKVADTSYRLNDGLILDLLIVNSGPYSGNYKLLNIDNSIGGRVKFNFTNNISFTSSTSLTGIQYNRGTNNSAFAVNTDLFSAIPAAINNFPNLVVEPSLVYEFYNDWEGVNEITVPSNYQSDGAYTYSPLLPLVPTPPINLTGNIELYEGYNFGINLDTINNNIDLQVSNSNGIPVSCNDFFIAPELSDCDSIISFINGVPPDSLGNFNIAPGQNINLQLGTVITNSTTGLPENFYDDINMSEPANAHSLFIGLTLQQSDLCVPLAILP